MIEGKSSIIFCCQLLRIISLISLRFLFYVTTRLLSHFTPPTDEKLYRRRLNSSASSKLIIKSAKDLIFIKQFFKTHQRLAVGVGFEPTVRSHAQRFSRPPRSATPAPHHNQALCLYLLVRQDITNIFLKFKRLSIFFNGFALINHLSQLTVTACAVYSAATLVKQLTLCM